MSGEALNNTMGYIMIVLLCLMVLTLLILAVAALLDSISGWKRDRKRGEK